MVVLRVDGHDRRLLEHLGRVLLPVLSTTTWLICERVVGWQGSVVYQVRIPRVLPIGDSSSKTGSRCSVLCSSTCRSRCCTTVSMFSASRIRLRSGPWWNSVGISIRSDARKRSTNRINWTTR